MEIIELLPGLRMLRFPVGQAYVWQDAGSVTLIDTGIPGQGEAIRSAVDGRVDRILLTHFHGDHTGSAAEVRAWSGAEVYAHRADADLVRGLGEPPLPDLLDWERPLFEKVGGHLCGPPVPVDHELTGDEVLDFGGGAQVLPIPGHTAGSVAYYLPEHRVLFTGDTVAEADGQVILGVFNVDRAQATESMRSLADLDVEVACFGHGDPVLSGARDRLRDAVPRSS